MTEKGQKKLAAAKLSKRLWRGSRESLRPTVLTLIVVLGIALAVGAYYIQQGSPLQLNASGAEGVCPLRINELMCDNRGSLVTSTGLALDWIEITNTGSEAYEIKDCVLMLESKLNKSFVFPQKLLQSGECLLIWAGGDELRGEWNAPFKLPASGSDALALLDAHGVLADRVDIPELSADVSYARDEQYNWSVSAFATPGEPNAQENALSLGIALQEGAVEISEVSSRNVLWFPDENGIAQDYVEIHNLSDEDIDLTGWYLSDSGDKLMRWELPALILGAGDYHTIHCSGLDRKADIHHLHTNFGISGDGNMLYLSTAEGKTVSMAEIPALQKGQAYSLVEDGWTTQLPPTPGLANTAEAAAQVYYSRFGDCSGELCISEIVASPTQQDCDWIEIYNAGSQSIDLSGYGLTDNIGRPHKYTFPSGSRLGANEYMCICFSGSLGATYAGYPNASFKLASEGGYTVALTDDEGSFLDAVYLPAQYAGVAYARAKGERGFHYFTQTTPMSENTGAYYREKAQAPQYSVEGGLFTTGDSFSVEIRVPAGSRVYYTLDSSDPSETSTLYSEPIQVTGTTILRTRVYRDGCLPSFIDTQSYLYDVQAEGAYVVSLVSDPDGLISDERGIMVKGPNALPNFPYGSMNTGANFWMDWEREAHIEVFTPEGEKVISQGCGIKLHGQYSRAASVKAFKVYAREEYGSNRFSYPIFKNRDYTEYKSFLLRAAGQDYNRTFMRDPMLTSLAKDLDLMYQESELAVCYIDGQYYSMYWLREHINTFSICQFEDWGGQEDDIDLIKANSRVMQGSNDTYAQLNEWVKSHDMSTQEAYDHVASVIDMENYINYMCIEIFVGNGDTLNVKRYRNANADGKWRWVLFDLDWAFDVDTNSIRRWLDPSGMGTNKGTSTTLFIGLMKNPIFADQFLTRFGELLATRFSTQNTQSMIEERFERLKPLLSQYTQRIGKSAASYKKDYNELMDYALTRPRKILGYFDGVFNFSDEQKQRYFGEALKMIAEAEGT